MPLRRSAQTGDISWRDAVFGGACLGGLMWATIIRIAMALSGSGPSVVTKWTIVAVGCTGLIAAGLAVAQWASSGALRTAGVAAVIAPLTAPAVYLGLSAVGLIIG